MERLREFQCGLPLLFASNALFPTSLMPDWLQNVAKVNPVTYGTVAGDFLFLGAFAFVFASIGTALSWRYLTK